MRVTKSSIFRFFFIFQFLLICNCGEGEKSSIHWGATLFSEDTDTEISVLDQLQVKYAHASVVLAGYDGKITAMEKLSAHGFKVILTISNEVGGVAQKFPRDMDAYRASLSEVLDKYQPEIAIIEDEPTNVSFYNDDMSFYLTELKNAIEVCHDHGVKVADGALHVTAIDMISKGQLDSDIAQRQKELLDGYATLDLDYVNLHMAVGTTGLGDDSSFPSGLLQEVTDYIVQKTGHDVISNQFSLHTPSVATLKSVISEFEKTNLANDQFKYAFVFSSTNDDAEPLNSGLTLTSLGETFRDSIK